MRLDAKKIAEQNLMGMSHDELLQFFSLLDEKPFRAT